MVLRFRTLPGPLGKLLEPKPSVDIRMRQAHARVETREPS